MVRLLTAHREEARPFIETLGLQSAGRLEGFTWYRSDDVELLLTGQGRESAGAATRVLRNRCGQNPDERWLNFGIAGSGIFSPGSLVAATSVVEMATGTHWKGLESRVPHCDRATVYTVDSVETGYARPGMFDMEASGVATVLSTHGELSRLTCIKLITDGPENPATRLNLKRIRSMIDPVRPLVVRWLQYLSNPSLTD